MTACGDPLSGKTRKAVEVPDGEPGWSQRPGHRQLDHPVEIAVIKPAVPANADQRTAHEIRYGSGIEMIHQKAHVNGILAAPVKKIRKALDGEIGKRVQMMERDPKVFAKLLSVVCFQSLLLWSKRGAQGIVNQVEG